MAEHFRKFLSYETTSTERDDEMKNHLGEREFQTYEGWKRAVKKIDINAEFTGDREIDNAVGIGEWDGSVGCIYNTNPEPDKQTVATVCNRWALTIHEARRVRDYLRGSQTSAEFDKLNARESAAVNDYEKMTDDGVEQDAAMNSFERLGERLSAKPETERQPTQAEIRKFAGRDALGQLN